MKETKTTLLRRLHRDYVIALINNQKKVVFKQVLFDGEEIYLKPVNPEFQTINLKQHQYSFKGVLVEARMNFKRS